MNFAIACLLALILVMTPILYHLRKKEYLKQIEAAEEDNDKIDKLRTGKQFQLFSHYAPNVASLRYG